jgi:trk system potassium uptake protein TrkH
VNALFQSVTLRTAGFNSVPLGPLRPATTLMMLVWMLVGASPGGTGGGIKTTTAVVLIGTVLAVLARRERIVLFGRSMSLDTIYRSAAIATVAGIVVTGGTFLLLATQPQHFEVLLFETVSAFGTVGLSLGATAQLDLVGKVVIMLLMFIGRVGPLTLALMVGRAAPSRVDYPDSRIMVG